MAQDLDVSVRRQNIKRWAVEGQLVGATGSQPLGTAIRRREGIRKVM